MPNPFNKLFASLLIFATVAAISATAYAEELLVLVTEQVEAANDPEDLTQAYWWTAGPAPSWTASDIALREALASQGATFSESVDLTQLSRIYQRPTPSNANAAAMASVFGKNRVLVGTIRYGDTSLAPVGLEGRRATVELQLLERASDGVTTLAEIDLERSRWAPSRDEALVELRADVATAIARSVAGSLKRKVGPVGLSTEELLIGVRRAGTRAALEALRSKLRTLAGVVETRERWATEGFVVLEINPGKVDSEQTIRGLASLLVSEGTEDYQISSATSEWPNVIAVTLEETVEEGTP